MVVFDESCVAPLYVATRHPMAAGSKRSGGGRQPPLAWFWTSGGNPNPTLADGPDGTQRTRQVRVGSEVLFVPPGPLDYVSSHMRRVKRRRVARQRDLERRRERRQKQQRGHHPDVAARLCQGHE